MSSIFSILYEYIHVATCKMNMNPNNILGAEYVSRHKDDI